jgi:hypothetical protein
MEESMEDAAHQACMIYHAQRFEKMKEDPFRFLPCYNPRKDRWEMMEPQGLDTTTKVMVRFAKEILRRMVSLRKSWKRKRRLANELQGSLMSIGPSSRCPRSMRSYPEFVHHRSL